jgi:hypothetical protein
MGSTSSCKLIWRVGTGFWYVDIDPDDVINNGVFTDTIRKSFDTIYSTALT